jgi:hypothetical protein
MPRHARSQVSSCPDSQQACSENEAESQLREKLTSVCFFFPENPTMLPMSKLSSLIREPSDKRCKYNTF